MSRRSTAVLLVHIVTATFRRRPLLPKSRDLWMREMLGGIARKWGADLVAAGGSDDHLHVVVRFPPVLSISRLAGYMKGTSACLWNQDPDRPNNLYWQDGFWAATCADDGVEVLSQYVASQREHHASRHMPEPWEFALGSFADATD